LNAFHPGFCFQEGSEKTGFFGRKKNVVEDGVVDEKRSSESEEGGHVVEPVKISS
jgi:hypothetical protein